MDLETLRDRKAVLAESIQDLVSDFIEDTGTVPIITVDYHTVNTMGGTTRHFPTVGVTLNL